MAHEAVIDAALLDVNLHGRNTFGVAEILRERQVPFVFATGYGAQGIEDRYRAVPTLTKPYRRDELDGALHQALAAAGDLEGGFPDPGPPAKTTSPRQINLRSGRRGQNSAWSLGKLYVNRADHPPGGELTPDGRIGYRSFDQLATETFCLWFRCLRAAAFAPDHCKKRLAILGLQAPVQIHSAGGP